MNFETATSIFSSFFKTLGYLFLFMVFGLFLDSTYMTPILPQTQHLVTFVMLIGFAIVYFRSTSRIREQMITAVIIGYIGEHLFSIALGM